ncbi:MAG: acyltransferase [Pseudonocardiales bacterium]|nr:acyltransferase [Pseudonocardiales bacterium]
MWVFRPGVVVAGQRRDRGVACDEAPSSRPIRRGDVQGLRAVAVLAVVLYHAGVPGLGGGYVGVDCFFVIFGFLITGLLVAEAARQGRVRFAAFYARRARRVLPASMLVLLVTAAASVAWLAPLQARQVVRDCLASSLFVGKYRFAACRAAACSTPAKLRYCWPSKRGPAATSPRPPTRHPLAVRLAVLALVAAALGRRRRRTNGLATKVTAR